MNVERVRSFEIDPTETPRERSGAKGSGFSDLMDSVLGPAVDKRSAGGENARSRSSETRDSNASRGRDLRAGSTGVRKSVKKENPDSEEVSTEATSVANEPVRKESGSIETGAKMPRDEETDAEAQIVAAADAASVEAVVGPLGIPMLQALAAGTGSEEIDSDEIDAVEIVVDEVGADVATQDGILEGLESGLTSDGSTTGEAGLAEATNGRSVIADASAREGFLAALEAARAGEEGAEVVGEGEAASAVEMDSRIETAPVVERTLSVATRPLQGADDAKRSELEAALQRAGGVPRQELGSQANLGSDDSSRERRDTVPQPVLAPVEGAKEPAASAPTSAAIDATSPSALEAPFQSEEASAQTRADGLIPTTSTRAPEAPPTLQGARALPTAAPDAIAVQADWLATRGGGTARLVLNPPELGEIAIRVTVRQQSVEIVMVAQTALAHSMAEDQGDRLSQAFAHRDMRLDQFEVRRGDPSDSSGTGQFGSSDAGNRERERAAEERGGLADSGGRAGRRPAGVAGGAVAAAQRIVPGRQDARVDLRI